MIQLNHISLVKYTHILRKAVDAYQRRIDETLADTPICGVLMANIDVDDDRVGCQFWLTSESEPIHVYSYQGKLLANVGDFKQDVDTSLSWYLGKAQDMKEMWNSENLNHYLVHPEEWRRVAAKAIYQAKQADRLFTAIETQTTTVTYTEDPND